MSRVTAIIGGQYGSEGKGAVVQRIADRYNTHVRVGGPNAGHTIRHRGVEYKMQVVPCGWINPNAMLLIGRGGMLDLDLFRAELAMVAAVDPTIYGRVFVDSGTLIMHPEFHNSEGGVHGSLHQAIGSTGEGIGAARHARMARRETPLVRFAGSMREEPIGPTTLGSMIAESVADVINTTGGQTLIEGTQGSELSLIHGPWPYVTSADTGVAQLLADTGVAPRNLAKTIMVLRTFPIRVAGNSGPLPNEISWAELSREIGRNVEERTTVTKKIRRIARWDDEVVRRAVVRNAPDSLCINFIDYLFPGDTGKTEWDELSDAAKNWILDLEVKYQAAVEFIGTGGPDLAMIEV